MGKKSEEKKKVWKTMLLLGAAIMACLGFTGGNRRYLEENPLNQYVSLAYPSACTTDESGGTYVIDQSKQRVVAFTKDGKYLYEINGGSRSETAFYSAELIKADGRGNLYLLDVVLGIDGVTIEKERILKFDNKGAFAAKVYEVVYEAGNRPMTAGRIKDMVLTEDGLEFVFSEEDQITLTHLSFSGNTKEILRQISYDTRYLISYGVDQSNEKLYAVTKTAEILEIHDDGTSHAVYKGEDHNTKEFFSIPWKVVADDRGWLYFTDIGLRRIGYITPQGECGAAMEREDLSDLGNNRIFYTLDVSPGRVLSTIGDMNLYIHQIEGEGETIVYGNGEEQIRVVYSRDYLIFRGIVYGAAMLAAVFLVLLLYLVKKLNIRWHFSEMARNNVMIVAVAVIITAVTVPSIMSSMQKQYQAQVMSHMSSVAEMACRMLDPGDVEQLNTPQDYTSEAYNRVKESIQNSFSSENGWNEGLYCVLNRVTDSKIIYSCLYLEDTIGSVYPLDYSYEYTDTYHSMSDSGYDSEYKELYETGRQIRFDWIENTDGIWTYVLSPVINEKGEVVAAMEVGTNLYAFQEANSAMVKNMIFNIVSIVALIILIFTELTFVWYSREGRRREIQSAKDPGTKGRELAVYVIRPMIFVIFMADCMATAFLPILTNQLAVPLWGIPAELMSAIPISAEVLFTAVFSFMGGYLLEKSGFRRVLLSGSVLFTAGLAAAGCCGSLLPFIGAKALIGTGMGLLLVGINTLVASFPEKESAEGFSFYNSGSLAGLTVGICFSDLAVEGAFEGFSFCPRYSCTMLLIN